MLLRCHLLPLLSCIAQAIPTSQWHDHRQLPFQGYDLSSLKIMEDGGVIYKDSQCGNVTKPVEDILGERGMNTVRLRLWVNPKAPYDGQ